jgi:hypothetical protein
MKWRMNGKWFLMPSSFHPTFLRRSFLNKGPKWVSWEAKENFFSPKVI